MGKRYIISYASDGYYSTQKRFMKSVLDKNVIKQAYNDKWLKKTDFYTKNKQILDNKRGGGYWLWKPYIILETLRKANDGDIILYCDSDAVALKAFEVLFNLCEKEKNGIMIFDNSYNINREWTKRDCFVLMDSDSPLFYNARQAMGGFLLIQKNEISMKFVNEWLTYACDSRILTDEANVMNKENLPEFKEHRHDQSILSILSIKFGLSLFRDPSQYGNSFKIDKYREEGEFLINGKYDENNVMNNSPYPTLIDLRGVLIEKKTIFTKLINRFRRLI